MHRGVIVGSVEIVRCRPDSRTGGLAFALVRRDALRLDLWALSKETAGTVGPQAGSSGPLRKKLAAVGAAN